MNKMKWLAYLLFWWSILGLYASVMSIVQNISFYGDANWFTIWRHIAQVCINVSFIALSLHWISALRREKRQLQEFAKHVISNVCGECEYRDACEIHNECQKSFEERLADIKGTKYP